ncbi:MAG: hypothetical protein C0170_04785 [Hydrogenobaculum sp.]|nr:MAG: hypothetical protein C0170_04785 [Hydrogenobaculum sp.]
MKTKNLNFYLKELDEADKILIIKTAERLYKKKKRKELIDKLNKRAEEIEQGKYLTHEEFWDRLER